MFRILLVDDNPHDAFLLRESLKRFARPCHVDWVADGAAALDYLYQRGAHAGTPHPHLILMDLNMPQLDGLETLRIIKGDPELRVIPAIMVSSSSAEGEVRRSYQAYANAYVRKPVSLEDSARLVQALEAFWVDLALPARSDGEAEALLFSRPPRAEGADHPFGANGGAAIASETAEAISQANGSRESDAAQVNQLLRGAGCEESRRLLDLFGAAVHELMKIHEEQFHAIVYGDGESSRFDLLIHMANEKKQGAKYAYMRHVDSHGCANYDALNETRTRSD